MSSSGDSDGIASYVVEDYLGVVRVYSDGTIVRSPIPAVPVPLHDEAPVECKDLPFSSSHSLLRLYRPRKSNSNPRSKLPVLLHFHGGGFCVGSFSWPPMHNENLRLASDLPALVIAPDYRLAPEHPLPAAIDDASAALAWLRSQASSPNPDLWLAESADFSRVFISGESAGANLVHHLALRWKSPDLNPLRVRGYVLLMPFFGGTQRTKSEAECPQAAFLNLDDNDRFWRLALPRGATTDSPTANPLGPENPSLEGVEMEAMLVVVGGKDLLRDRGVEYAERLKKLGKPVEMVEFEREQHGFFVWDCNGEAADELVCLLKRFVSSS